MTTPPNAGHRVVVVHSGGLDSSVLLAHYARTGLDVRALAVHYGQRHHVELDAGERFARRLRIPRTVINVPLWHLTPGNALTDPTVDVPHGHYADDSMRATVVPNRNMVLLSLAIAHAAAIDAGCVAYGAHAGDHAVYPDCREPFAEAMARAAAVCHYQPIALLRPFLTWSKADIVAAGARLGVPFELTWSCYEGTDEPIDRAAHCGACGTCVERREAFVLAGVPDPTRYRA